MKRLMIPVGAGALALAGTVALALGPDSSAEWGVDGAASGVLSVQRSAVVAGDQETGDAPRPDDVPEPHTRTVRTEPTTGAEPTLAPAQTTAAEATKEPASTPSPLPVEPKGAPATLATQVPTLPPWQGEHVQEKPASTKRDEPRVAKDEPARANETPDAAAGKRVDAPETAGPTHPANAGPAAGAR